MQNKFFFILLLVLSFGLSNASAQEPTSTSVRKISGGVLNGKALTLVKPSYPAAARAVGASGAVNVQVTIDEEGNVIEAAAVSGHPLLRAACEEAARASKFAPTKLEGQPVIVTGVIVYNFVMPMTLNQAGYELSLAENSQSIKRSQISSISEIFPASWAEEKEALKSLESRLTKKIEKEKPPQPLPPANDNVSTTKPPREGIATRIGSYSGSTSRDSAISVDENYSLDDDSVAIIKDLQSKLENRLTVRENLLWSFRLGKVLGKLKADLDSDEKTRASVSELNQLSADAPSGISEAATAKIKEHVESLRQTAPKAEVKQKLTRLIEDLRNLKTY